jgi:hypothetical protein
MPAPAPEARTATGDNAEHPVEWVRQPRIFDTLLPAFFMLYAAWTVFANVLVVLHASFDSLMRWLPVPLMLGGAALYAWTRGQHEHSPKQVQPAPTTLPIHRNVVLVAAVTWVGVLIISRQYTLFWWGSIFGLLAAWAWFAGTAPGSSPMGNLTRGSQWTVLLLSLAAGCVTLVANRPDADDAFYQSIAANLLRFPTQPLLERDTLYHIAGMPIQLPVYRIHTYELLIGVVARTFDISPGEVAYVLLPAFFSVFAILSWGQLLRVLAPYRWTITLVTLFACVLMLGETHRSYGNFAFVRMFQGKAILASVVVPYIIYQAIQFSRHGKKSDWILLAAAQIAAIGITSTALFVAPVAVAVALAGTWLPTAKSMRRTMLALMASCYVIAIGGLLVIETQGGQSFIGTRQAMPSMLDVLTQTFGAWSLMPLLVALLATWAFAEGHFQSRFLLASSLCFFILVLNPYSYQFVAAHLTGLSTYWRLEWALPIPLLLAILLVNATSPITHLRPRILPAIAGLVSLSILALFAFHAGTLRESNGVTLGSPGYKVPKDDYAAAKELVSVVPESGKVLVPERVSTWIPTFIVRPRLLSARALYLPMDFDEDEAARRLSLVQYVGGERRAADAPEVLGMALRRDDLTAVMIFRDAPWFGEMTAVLARHGWTPAAAGSYEVWTKPGASLTPPSPI